MVPLICIDLMIGDKKPLTAGADNLAVDHVSGSVALIFFKKFSLKFFPDFFMQIIF